MASVLVAMSAPLDALGGKEILDKKVESQRNCTEAVIEDRENKSQERNEPRHLGEENLFPRKWNRQMGRSVGKSQGDWREREGPGAA